MAVYEVSIVEWFGYTDQFKSNIGIGTFSDSLLLAETITHNYIFTHASDGLDLLDNMSAGPNTIEIGFSDSLDFDDEIARGRTYVEFGDLFFMYDALELVETSNMVDTLDLTEDWVVTTGIGLYDTLDYTEVWSLDITKSMQIADTLMLVDGIHGYFNDRWRSHYPDLEP